MNKQCENCKYLDDISVDEYPCNQCFNESEWEPRWEEKEDE